MKNRFGGDRSPNGYGNSGGLEAVVRDASTVPLRLVGSDKVDLTAFCHKIALKFNFIMRTIQKDIGDNTGRRLLTFRMPGGPEHPACLKNRNDALCHHENNQCNHDLIQKETGAYDQIPLGFFEKEKTEVSRKEAFPAQNIPGLD